MTMDLVWMIIVVVLMGVLPDLLRRKRRYPRSKGPIPVPPRRKPAPAPKMEAPEPEVPEPSFPDWDEGWDNMNSLMNRNRASEKDGAATGRCRTSPVCAGRRAPARPSGSLERSHASGERTVRRLRLVRNLAGTLAHRKGFIKK